MTNFQGWSPVWALLAPAGHPLASRERVPGSARLGEAMSMGSPQTPSLQDMWHPLPPLSLVHQSAATVASIPSKKVSPRPPMSRLGSGDDRSRYAWVPFPGGPWPPLWRPFSGPLWGNRGNPVLLQLDWLSRTSSMAVPPCWPDQDPLCWLSCSHTSPDNPPGGDFLVAGQGPAQASEFLASQFG